MEIADWKEGWESGPPGAGGGGCGRCSAAEVAVDAEEGPAMGFVGCRVADDGGGLLEDAAPSDSFPFPLRPRCRVFSACSLRQRLVKGRFAGPISWECSEMSVGPG